MQRYARITLQCIGKYHIVYKSQIKMEVYDENYIYQTWGSGLSA